MSEEFEYITYAISAFLGVGAIALAAGKIKDYLSDYFVTTEKYNNDKEEESKSQKKEAEKTADRRSKCRQDMYEKINEKADKSQIKELSNKIDESNKYQMEIIKSISNLTGKVEMLTNRSRSSDNEG